MINILHIVPDLNFLKGGLSYASVRLANEQSKSGINVSLLSIESTKSTFFSDWQSSSIKIYCQGGMLRKYFIFLKYIVANKNKIFHFHGVWYVKYIPMYIILIIFGINYFISPHGNYEPNALKNKFIKKYLARKIIFDFILKKSKLILVNSNKEFNSLLRVFPKKIIKILPIGIDIPNKLNRSFHSDKTILIISRINPYKGLLNLIKAWYIVKIRGWKIVIAGPDDNGYLKFLLSEVSSMGLNNSISFIGPVDAIQRDLLYSSAHFFVLPSLSENFGIVVAEALSYGIPVLTTTETPWVELGITNGCRCVAPTVEDLVIGLREMMAIENCDMERIGNAGRDYITKNFSWPKITSLSIEYIKEIARI
jgi:glycosyltransferase involved in cell wall biosynthesis